MTQEEFYKDRCKKLEDLIKELSSALWGNHLPLIEKVNNILDESYTDHQFENEVKELPNQNILDNI